MVCLNCGGEIPKSKRSNAKYCTDKCGNSYRNKRYYDRNPEFFAAKREKYNARAESRILTKVKSRAKKKGIPFNLEHVDISIPDTCPVLGIPIYPTFDRCRGYKANLASLDRVVPEMGYVKGNVRVISYRANMLKSDSTIEEMELILEDLRKCQKQST